MHIHRAATTTPWPAVPFGAWRLWDCYVSWPWIEPAKKQWDFTVLDADLALAERNRAEILLPLGLTPAWASHRPVEPSAYSPGNAAEPANMDDWREYVRTVATRYKQRVRYYEIWNEPNLKGFFSGTPQQMLQLSCAAYAILKQIDPAIQVISPAATSQPGITWLAEYLRLGGASCSDVIGFHFYVSPQPPEAMLGLILSVQAVMTGNGAGDKPLWNTEAGWFIENRFTRVLPQRNSSFSRVLTSDEATAYVARSYILNWAAGVSRFYWYSWDSEVGGLTEADGKTLKSPATAYAQIEHWLAGWRMISCVPDANETWVCEMSRGRRGGRVVAGDADREWIAWNPNRSIAFKIPATWRVKQITNLFGNSAVIAANALATIGPAPLLFETASP